MAKVAYKVPDNLAKSPLDAEITIQTKGGISIRPMPISYLLVYVFSFIFLAFILARTPVNAGGVGLCILFAIVWLALTFLLMRRDDTGYPQASLVASMANYFPKTMRRVNCRSSAPAAPFRNICGIEGIDEKTGFIQFIDGTVGFAYRVVGTGSVLLFAEDRNAIIDRCDMFFRKVKPDTQLIFITCKEPQKVAKQVSASKARQEGLAEISPELAQLCEEQTRILSDEIGNNYRSIHQYLILKADNPDALVVSKNILRSECENSQMVFKQCGALFGGDIIDVLRELYQGVSA